MKTDAKKAATDTTKVKAGKEFRGAHPETGEETLQVR